ncbi:MAG: hypothetical protein LBF57_02240 [Holosporaceae bacterium]|nr:hypothetical protein [Holosporaceae bacterium]
MDEIIIKNNDIDVTRIIFLFHGYGANKNDLVPIGEAFLKAIPDAEIHLPNGIESCEGAGGYQWFPLEGYDTAVWNRAFQRNLPRIKSYIDDVIADKQLLYGNIIVSGFSQGAMLSLSLGLELGTEAVIAFSGLLFSLGSVVQQNTKILLTHGAKDEVISINEMFSAEKNLKERKISVETAVSEHLSHAIDDHLLLKAVDFLKKL